MLLDLPLHCHAIYKPQEWLITTDKVQHVLDLVKLDGERIVNTGNGCRSADTCDALVSALVMRSDLFVDGRYAD